MPQKTWPAKLGGGVGVWGVDRLRQLGQAKDLGLTRSVRVSLVFAIALAMAVSLPNAAAGREPVLIAPDDGPAGRPHVVLDRLVVPQGLPERQRVSRVLEKALKREALRVKWGAGRGSRISYRFYLEELSVNVEQGVLKVSCTALGRLPKGKSARSKLEFGGDPRNPHQVVDHVLTIVARGVLARLANLERQRRSRR